MTFTVVGAACRASSSRLAVCARVSMRREGAQFNPLECSDSRLLLVVSRDDSGRAAGVDRPAQRVGEAASADSE